MVGILYSGIVYLYNLRILMYNTGEILLKADYVCLQPLWDPRSPRFVSCSPNHGYRLYLQYTWTTRPQLIGQSPNAANSEGLKEDYSQHLIQKHVQYFEDLISTYLQYLQNYVKLVVCSVTCITFYCSPSIAVIGEIFGHNRLSIQCLQVRPGYMSTSSGFPLLIRYILQIPLE